ncbi:MAG: hypothetical protein L6R42_002523 [Xanthoria sp. 1 TBL-2021]|nr:MAG: hypothetical protein L6R42_002523 [Xanthoria sp. 1 TBL-2021]
MAASGIETLSSSQTNQADQYDHPINLVDSTKPKVDKGYSEALPESSGASLTRRWTRGTLRKELAQRKYARWQQDRSNLEEDAEPADPHGNQAAGDESKFSSERAQGKEGQKKGLSKKIQAKSEQEKPPKQHENQDSAIDILYENQRGWFLFGMPLYSANSLLNLDPAAWQTSTFHDSPVNITNAQVPDPSWEWAWKTWYVDMSHDVDEEGWEYSFSFQSRFAWHGSHPWFHSFARRRRWLRKRVKVRSSRITEGKGGLKDSHRLNADYFTIHGAKRDRSPNSSAERASANRSSFMGYDGQDSDSEEDLHDIPNLLTLLAVLKKATVDREKIVAVRTFLAQGGEELHYLSENMDEIMGLLIYQTSRQQLYRHISEALDNASEDQVSGNEKEDAEQEAKERQIDNLSRAADASRAYLDGLEYWKDASMKQKLGKSSLTVEPAFGKDDVDWPEETKAHIEEEKATNEIRGIPDDADTDFAPSLLRTAQGQAEGSARGSLDKGKRKAEE